MQGCPLAQCLRWRHPRHRCSSSPLCRPDPSGFEKVAPCIFVAGANSQEPGISKMEGRGDDDDDHDDDDDDDDDD